MDIETSRGDAITFRATINGRALHARVPPENTLLDVLRNSFDLTGAKRGCDIGLCGTCTVILDGRAVLSCLIKAEHAAERRIETIEGLATSGQLHPLQQAFVAAHGFQCGYCTPGFIMSAKALLDRHPTPTNGQIRRAIKKNLCRCTGYQQIVEAIELASGQAKEEELDRKHFRIARYEDEETASLPWAGWEFRVLGRSQPRKDGWTQTTGGAKYTADHKLAGMLWGKTVRSPHPHAKIRRIHTAAAEALPGVVRVLTWRDIPGENAYGKRIRDQQVLARERVRYVGEPVALAIAESPESAARAVDLVNVEYELLPGVYDPEEAMNENAPKVHEGGNVLSHYHLEKGDLDKGFAEADVIIEGRYKTQPQDHSPLEPEAAVAYYDETGRLTVLSPGQSVFFDRLNIIRALGIPKEDVRCLQPAIGAAFGKREDIYAQIHAALACFITGQAVTVEWSREETMLVTTKRTQQRTTLRTGVKKTGEITAFEARIVGDAGAYASWSVNIMRKAGVLVSGPYEIPNVLVDSYAVYTNNPVSGATRGFGAAETNFCSESHVDEVARAIGMNPLEFRLKNVLRRGSATATGHRLDSFVPVEATIREAARDFGWRRRLRQGREVNGRRRGIGMSTMSYGIGFGVGIEDTTDAIVELNEDGTATLYVGTVDYGNGSNTTFAMLAAEVLGISVENIEVINADSDRTKNCGSTVATKQTYTTGNAVVRACRLIRRDLCKIAAQLLAVPEERISLHDGSAYAQGDPSRQIPIEELTRRFQEFGRPRRREALFKAHQFTEPLDPHTGQGKAWFPLTFGTQMAEVEVDVRTGEVEVKEIVAAHYVGRVLNPRALRGQVVGGVSMGVGFALWEDCQYLEGVPQALNYDKYRLMRVDDVPHIRVIAIERDEATGPFGAIGIGEPPTVPTAAAIANAVRDAIGERLYELPLTPERVLAELRKGRHGQD